MRRRPISTFIVALYAATATFGIPRLHSHLRRGVEAGHAELVAYEATLGRPGSALRAPSFQAYSFPILPGVLICSEQFTIARLVGEGHISIYWVAGPSLIQLFDHLTWIS